MRLLLAGDHSRVSVMSQKLLNRTSPERALAIKAKAKTEKPSKPRLALINGTDAPLQQQRHNENWNGEMPRNYMIPQNRNTHTSCTRSSILPHPSCIVRAIFRNNNHHRTQRNQKNDCDSKQEQSKSFSSIPILTTFPLLFTSFVNLNYTTHVNLTVTIMIGR